MSNTSTPKSSPMPMSKSSTRVRLHHWIHDGVPAALILVLAVVAAVVLSAVGTRYHARFDVTTTGEQQLAPRTKQLLAQAGPLDQVEIVVAADMRAIDPWSRRAVGDVLDLFANEGHIHTTQIDIASPEGLTQLTELIQRLIDRDRAGIDQHARVIAAAAAGAGEIVSTLESELLPALGRLENALPANQKETQSARDGIGQWAQVLKLNAAPLSQAATAAADALIKPDPARPLPPLTAREISLRSALEKHATEFASLAEELDKIVLFALAPEAAKTEARASAAQVRALRDQAARQADALARLPKLDILRISDALAANQIALVIGPPGTGVAGIDINELYQPTLLASDGGRLVGDVRSHAEELFAAALSAVLSNTKPIVVLTHSENARVLEDSPFFTSIQDRLAQRGIDMTEWQVGDPADPITLPDLSELDPDGARPVVYVILSPDSSASARKQGDQPGPKRAAALGNAVAYLLDHHLPMLVNTNPSILPSYGEPDPIVAPLKQLGLTLSTGTPLLREVVSTRDRQVRTDLTSLPEPSSNPISQAIANLPTLLTWPIPLEITPHEGWEVVPLLEITDTGSAWAESQWLGYWQTARAQRSLLPNLPRFDADSDRRADHFVVAVAADRTDAQPRAGRVVVVGSNGWYANPIAFAYQTTDGRVSRTYPGNAELFEAAVLYLAGMDEQIAKSASARAIPMIVQIEPARLRVLRWVLVAGLPIGVLVLGVFWRLVRR